MNESILLPVLPCLAITRCHDHLALLVLAHVHLKHCRLLILGSHKAVVKTKESLKIGMTTERTQEAVVHLNSK